MVKIFYQIAFVTASVLLSGCVTQNFDKDKPVIEQNSSNNELAITRVKLGLGYLNMGNTGQAKFNLEKAKKFAPNLVEVHTAFAHYFETVDEPELAIKSFKKALSIRSNDANTLNNYGVFLCRQENYDEAEKQFLKAIAIPSYLLVSESYENLASCQLKAGAFDKAERYLAKAVTHSPNSGSALYQMVRLEYAMGNYKKARRYVQKFEKVTRRFKPESLSLALKVYQQLGNQKTSKNYGSMLVRMYPNSWEAKQYVLNGLDHIEADDLAERYQESKANDKKPKKRVVVLSPNGQSSVKAKSKETKPKTITKEVSAVVEPEAPVEVPVKEAPAVVASLPEPTVSDAAVSTTLSGTTGGATAAVTVATGITALNENNEETSTVLVDDNTKHLIVADVTEDEVTSDESTAEELIENDSVITEVKIDQETVQQDLGELIDVDSNSEVVLVNEVLEDEALGENNIEEPLAQRAFHVVVKGDNLYGISVKYNIQMKALNRWNEFDENSKIRIGDKVYITEPLLTEGSDE